MELSKFLENSSLKKQKFVESFEKWFLLQTTSITSNLTFLDQKVGFPTLSFFQSQYAMNF